MDYIRKYWSELDSCVKSFYIAIPIFLFVVGFIICVLFFPITGVIIAITLLVIILFVAIWGAVEEVIDNDI